ncbi:MAG: protein kinase [Clostridia bacterium]|nr:protein kinase [Clostridia bacterium]
MSIEKLNTIWPDWKIVEKTGESKDGGKIYRAVKTNSSFPLYSSIKVISIPQNDSEILSLRKEGMEASQIAQYYNTKVNEIVDKAKYNISLSSAPNTVICEDCKVIRKEEGIGWDIFIRSELLVPFNAFLNCSTMSESDVIKLGVDIATSLEYCSRSGVLHKNIKPDSIFLTANGDFKLGDYSPEVVNEIGNYTSPEAAKNLNYTSGSDIYSLGIILYTLLNNNRLPLTDPYASEISFSQRSDAVKRRFAGEALPTPCNASEQLSNVIMLAVSADPEKRFKNAAAFKSALLSVAPLAGVSSVRVDYDKMVGVNAIPVNVEAVPPKPIINSVEQEFKVVDDREIVKPVIKKNKKKNIVLPIVLISVGAVLLITAIVTLCILFGGNSKKETESRSDEIINALENGNFDDALDLFLEFGSDKKLVKSLSDRLDQVYDDFYNGKITYERAKEELETIEKMNIKELSEKFISTRDKIFQLNDSKIAFEKAEEYYENGDYIKAIEQYMLVIITDPNYSAAQTKINSSKGKYKDSVIDECESLVSENKYTEAMDILENALTVFENDTELEGKLSSVKTSYVKYAVSQADTLLEEKKYDDAQALLEDVLSEIPDNEEIQEKIDEIPSIIEQDYIEEAQALADKGAYESAIKILDDALELLPDNENIIAKKKEILESQPVDINNLTIVDSSSGNISALSSAGTDAFGDSYNTGIKFTPTEDEASYIVYKLDGNFENFEATLTLPSSADSESKFTVEIFTDGKRAKRIKGYQMSDGNMNLNIDVSGKDELEIKISLTKGESDTLYFVNGVLSKG